MIGGLLKRIQKIKLLAMDVDGVLTDASVHVDSEGREFRVFSVRDGHGISMLHEAGLKTAFISRENTDIIRRRAEKLKITEIHTGIEDKLTVLAQIVKNHNLTFDEVAYIGDDVPDIPCLEAVGLAIAVSDAEETVKSVAHYITQRNGGNRAVREIANMILEAKSE